MVRFLLFCFVWGAGLGTSWGQAWQWAQAQGSGTVGAVQFKAMDFDAAGNTVLAGSFEGTVTLGSFTLTSAGGTDGVVARLSPTGQWLQAERLGGSGDDAVTAVTVSPNGVVWVAGGFSDRLVLGGTVLTSSGSGWIFTGLFIASLTTAGQWQYVGQSNGPGNVTRLLPEATGDVVLLADYSSAITFGTFTLPSAIIRNLAVARYRPGTGWLHAACTNTGSYVWADDAVPDAAGNIVIAGHLLPPSGTATSISFGAQTATIPQIAGSLGNGNILFVARFGPGGTWTQLTCASPGTSGGAVLALDVSGNALVASALTAFRGAFGTLTLQNPVPTTGSGSNFNYYPFLARLNAAGTWTQVQGGVGPGLELGLIFNPILRTDGSYLNCYRNTGGLSLRATSVVGSTSWSLGAISPYGIIPCCFRVSPAGQLVVAGTFYYPSATFGSLALATNDQETAFVASAGGLPLAAQAPSSGLSALMLFPSPAHAAATLRLPGASPEALPVFIIDALGRTVSRQTLPAHATETMLDLTALPPGLYLVRAGATTGRLVVE